MQYTKKRDGNCLQTKKCVQFNDWKVDSMGKNIEDVLAYNWYVSSEIREVGSVFIETLLATARYY